MSGLFGLFSSFLTLCLAVGASGEKILICTNGLSAQSLLLISCANSELNSEPQAAASFGSHQLSLLLSAPNTVQHQISLVHAAPNFSLLSSTKFLSLLSSTKFLFAVQHQFFSLLCSTNFSLCCAAPNFSLRFVYYFALKVVCFIATRESIIGPVVQ